MGWGSWYWDDPDKDLKYENTRIANQAGIENILKKMGAEGWTCLGSNDDDYSWYLIREKSGYKKPVDRILVCQDCHSSFTFTVIDQRFFRSKNFAEPKRCLSCREKRKSSKYTG